MVITSLDQLQFINDLLLFNVIMDSDSYKTSHWMQYPPGTQYVHSYLESRGGPYDTVIPAGFQYEILRYLTGVVVTDEMIDVAKAMIVPHMGGNPDLFNEEGWRHIVRVHGGRLPLKIKAIPEGTRIKPHNVLMSVINTDEKCYWLVNYMETMLMRVWYPTSVATLSYAIREIILEYLEKTGTPASIDFMLQDFGSRGSTSRESASIGAAAHSLIFKGSDTMIALPYLFKYYLAKSMPFFSVPASEHSTITSWLKEHEVDAIRNMLVKYPEGIVSIVSDSFDIFNACKEIFGNALKNMVIGRKGVTVIRPDSGEVIPTVLKCLDILAERFGYEMNGKGYKVLPSFVRLLQGDGMNIHSIRALCRALEEAGWSLDNMACFGMGGKLLQSVDRDTLKFAFKCSAICVNGEWRDVYKDPVTDPGKASKKGILSLKYFMNSEGTGGEFRTVPVGAPNRSIYNPTTGSSTWSDVFGDHLQTIFLNGQAGNLISHEEAWDNVRAVHYGKKLKNVANLKE